MSCDPPVPGTKLPGTRNEAPRSRAARGRRRTRLVAAAFAWLSLALAMGAPTSAGASQALTNGLGLIQRYYLFHDQVHTASLLKAALEEVERRFDAVHAEEIAPGAFLFEAGRCALRVEAAPSDDVRDLEEPLEQALQLLRDCVGDRDKQKDLPSDDLLLLNGVLAALDPYSTVLEGNRQTEHHIKFAGRLAGIGARIGIREGSLTLIQVYRGSPAYRSGLRDGDLVRRIDGLSTTNISVLDAVRHIRGLAGSEVILTVKRPDFDKLDNVHVTRALVTIPSVNVEMLPGGIVHAEITHYSQTTPTDFRRRVGELVGKDDVKGIVIDVRRNPGGSMLGSAAIADLFLNQGILITTAGRDGNTVRGLTHEIDATYDTPFGSLPVAVLTSESTASGSELMAASLRNHDRAILVGQKSFGKGTVQKTFPIGEGAVVKMTIGRFLPNKKVIPGGGLVPDIEVLPFKFGDQRVTIPDREPKELPYWLQTPKWAKADHREPIVRIFSVQHLADSTSSMDEEDTALEVAAMVLRRFPSTSASRMLDFAKVILSDKVAAADVRLSKMIADRGIDWSTAVPATGPAKLSLSVYTAETLRAGVDGDLHVRIKNDGSAPVYRMRGVVDSPAPLLNHRGLLFGRIDPGTQAEATLHVHPSARTRTGRLELSVQLFDDSGHLATLGPAYLAVAQSDRPRLRFRRRIDISPDGTLLTVVVEVTNDGRAAAKDLRVLLKHDLEGDFELLDGSATIAELAAGATQSLSFRVRMLGSFEARESTDLSIVSTDADVFLKSELPLAASKGFGPWLEAPRVDFQRIEPTQSPGLFAIRAHISDDRGLQSVLARIDGDQVERLVAGEQGQRQLDVLLPWRPAQGVKVYQVSVIDSDGLRTRYIAGL